MDAETLLRRWGFFAHPFRDTVAEQQKNSSQLFVMPPYFGDIVGDRASPRSSLLFGSRGDGKSALKIAVRDAFEHAGKTFLIIEYSEFSRFTENDNLGESDLNFHLEKILQILSEGLLQILESQSNLVTKLSAEQKSNLQWHLLLFPPNGSSRAAERRWIKLLNSLPDSKGIKRLGTRALRHTNGFLRRKRVELESSNEDHLWASILKSTLILLTPSTSNASQLAAEEKFQSLRELVSILKNLTMDGILILIDRLDETPLFARRPDLMAELIRPLLLSIPFLELEGVASKFFLPTRVFRDLRREIRVDRILTRQIAWSDLYLKEILKRRLSAFSDGKIETLKPFIIPEALALFERCIAFYSAKNPRNMFRMLDSILTELCNIHGNPENIDRQGIEAGVREFLRTRLAEGDGAEYQERLREGGEEPPLMNVS
jgi:hypothetical protein